MPLVIRQNKNKRQNQYKGEGFFDSLLSAVTSKVVQDTAKEVALNVGKKAATDIGNKAASKMINKLFPPNKKEEEPQKSKLTPESRELLNNILSRGNGIKRI